MARAFLQNSTITIIKESKLMQLDVKIMKVLDMKWMLMFVGIFDV